MYATNLGFSAEHINGKRVLLIGGGRTRFLKGMHDPNGFCRHEFRGVEPASITNIDPYTTPVPDQTLVPANFLTYACKPDSFDQSLALYSLPYYCRSAGEIEKFWAKSIYATDAGGDVRAYPLGEHKEYFMDDGTIRVPDINDWKPCPSTMNFLGRLNTAFPDVGIEYPPFKKEPGGYKTLVLSIPTDRGLKRELNDWTIENYP